MKNRTAVFKYSIIGKTTFTENISRLVKSLADLIRSMGICTDGDDLKWLYCELFRDHPEVTGTFSSLTKKMKEIYRERSLSMKEADQNCAADPDWFRKTTFTGKSICEVSRIYSHSGESSLTEPIRICSAVLVGFLHGKRTLTVDFFPGCPINWTISVNAKQTLCT